MQFTAILALAAAVVGVSANVHSQCYCIYAVTNTIDLATTEKSCTNYPRKELYNEDETLVTDPATVLLVQNDKGYCESQNAADEKEAAHLGGDQFYEACIRNAPDNVKVSSLCNPFS